MSIKDPVEALDDFLEALRREFHANPELAGRVVKALGGAIELKGSKAADMLNPLELVASVGVEEAKQRLSSFSMSELKRIAKSHRLASPIDLTGKNEAAIVKMIADRANNKIAERGA